MSTSDLLKKYERDGYIVLKNAMLKNECKKLVKNTIVPILHKKQIYLSKPESWKNKDNTKKHGQLIYGPKGGHIISKNNKHYRFPALFQSKKLNNILNIIHGRNANTIRNWQYKHLAKQGLGFGALDLNIIEFNKIPMIINLENFKQNLLKNRTVSDIFSEIGIDESKPIREQEPKPIPDRKVIDDAFFDAINLSSEERIEMYWSLCEMIKNRIKKADSIK